MKRLLGLMIACACCISAATASADVVWDGTGNNITENPADGNNNNSTLQITAVTTLDTTGAFQSPASDGSVYTGSNNGLSPGNPDFFAAVSDDSVLAGAIGFTIFDGGGNDLLGRVQVTGATAGTFDSTLVWQADAGTFETIDIVGFDDFGANVTGSELRFVFQEADGDWFVSDDTFAGTAGITDVSAVDWLAFTPQAGGAAVVGALATPDSFDDVQHVGFYQEFSTTGGGGVFSTGFSATFAAVPEPSSLGLLGLFASVGLLRRRR